MIRRNEDWLANHAGGKGARKADRPGARKRRDNPEERLQIAVAQWLDDHLHQDWRWWHTPNERGSRSVVNNAILSRCGVKAGVADVLIASPAGMIFWIELKSDEGSLSAAQNDWRRWCLSNGIHWRLCRSLDSLQICLRDWGIPLRDALKSERFKTGGRISR